MVLWEISHFFFIYFFESEEVNNIFKCKKFEENLNRFSKYTDISPESLKFKRKYEIINTHPRILN